MCVCACDSNITFSPREWDVYNLSHEILLKMDKEQKLSDFTYVFKIDLPQ